MTTPKSGNDFILIDKDINDITNGIRFSKPKGSIYSINGVVLPTLIPITQMQYFRHVKINPDGSPIQYDELTAIIIPFIDSRMQCVNINETLPIKIDNIDIKSARIRIEGAGEVYIMLPVNSYVIYESVKEYEKMLIKKEFKEKINK